jgi:HSP20 family protein
VTRPEAEVWGTVGRAGGGHPFDVIETKDKYELIADAPGFDAHEIHVDLDKNVLTISGQKEPAKPEEGQKQEEGRRVWRRERRPKEHRHFKRSFTLPQDAKHEDICAKLDKGVLTVCLPKVPEKPKSEVKRIEVQPAA